MGRDEYQEAIKVSNKVGAYAMAINAVAYWMEQEAYCGNIDRDYLDSVAATVQKRISELPSSQKKDAQRSWSARRTSIDNMLAEPVFSPWAKGLTNVTISKTDICFPPLS